MQTAAISFQLSASGLFGRRLRGEGLVLSQVFRRGGRDLGHPQLVAERGPLDMGHPPTKEAGLTAWLFARTVPCNIFSQTEAPQGEYVMG